MGRIQNNAVALQVHICGCSHCQWLLRNALGTTEETEKFHKYWNKKRKEWKDEENKW